jgi:hypothetical protein
MPTGGKAVQVKNPWINHYVSLTKYHLYTIHEE